MFCNKRVISYAGVCFVALLILASCQPGYSPIVPEEIGETYMLVEALEVAQPTIEQQTINQTSAEKEEPTAPLTFVEPTSSSLPDEVVPKILLIDGMANWDDLTYTRLIEIAASKGVEVDIFDNKHFIVDDRYDGIIVFGGGGGDYRSSSGTSRSLLEELHGFNVDGGRFIFFALPRLAIHNGFIGNPWIYSITVASEDISPPGRDFISVPGGVLSEMWSGLIIGSRTSYDEVSLQTYFKAKYIENFSHTSMSNRNGEQKITSISQVQHGKGDFLFVSNFVTGDADIKYRNEGNFLHDGNIDGWDNQRAAEILIDWLVGNQ